MRCLCCLLILVTACAVRGEAWPSLAARPIEGPASAGTGRCAAAKPTCAAPLAATGASPAAAAGTLAAVPTVSVATDDVDVAARLVVIDRDLTDAAVRLTTQRAMATTAAAAANGAKPDSEAWSKAQIELSALDRIGNQIGDIRGRLDAIAGTLAAASAGGTDVAAPLVHTGRLIARTIALQADYNTAAAALR